MFRRLLLDGSWMMYRGHYSTPPLTHPTTQAPTSAAYAFLKSLLLLLQEQQPSSLAVAWDVPTASLVRTVSHASYKGTRPSRPDGLSAQFESIQSLLPKLGIYSTSHPGAEADDLLASWAADPDAASDPSVSTWIVTGDKDLGQVVSDAAQVALYNPGRKAKVPVMDEAEVEAKFGVPPPLVPHVQALTGDIVDNIHGVPGVGPKSAAALINTYGSVSAVLTALGQPDFVHSARTAAVLKHADLVRDNLGLTTLDTSLPLPDNPKTWHAPSARDVTDSDVFRSFCHQHAFYSLIPKASSSSSSSSPQQQQPDLSSPSWQQRARASKPTALSRPVFYDAVSLWSKNPALARLRRVPDPDGFDDVASLLRAVRPDEELPRSLPDAALTHLGEEVHYLPSMADGSRVSQALFEVLMESGSPGEIDLYRTVFKRAIPLLVQMVSHPAGAPEITPVVAHVEDTLASIMDSLPTASVNAHAKIATLLYDEMGYPPAPPPLSPRSVSAQALEALGEGLPRLILEARRLQSVLRAVKKLSPFPSLDNVLDVVPEELVSFEVLVSLLYPVESGIEVVSAAAVGDSLAERTQSLLDVSGSVTPLHWSERGGILIHDQEPGVV